MGNGLWAVILHDRDALAPRVVEKCGVRVDGCVSIVLCSGSLDSVNEGTLFFGEENAKAPRFGIERQINHQEIHLDEIIRSSPLTLESVLIEDIKGQVFYRR